MMVSSWLISLIIGLASVLIVYGFAVIIKFIIRVRGYIKACERIPGYKRHWFFGNVHQMGDFSNFIFKMQDDFTSEKVTVIWLFYQPILLLNHPDTAKILLRTAEVKPEIPGYFLLFPWIGRSLLTDSGPHWERTRKLLTPAFHFDVLGPYFIVFNEVADEFLNIIGALAEKGSVDLFSPCAVLTLDSILQCSLSYKGGVQQLGKDHPYVQAVEKLGELVIKRSMRIHHFPPFLYKLSSDGREFHRLCDFVHDFSTRIIKERKKRISENPDVLNKKYLDFLDILLSAKDPNGNGLTEEEIRNEVDTFMFAGHETTAATLSWAMYCLGKHPEIQQKVHDEAKEVLGDREYVEKGDLWKLKYLNCFLKEVMRMYTPVPLITRQFTEYYELNGFTLPPGVDADINLYHMHHHPDVWDDPWKFDPDRFMDEKEMDPYSFVPFSAGPRNCIGQQFALNEEKVWITRIVRRFEILPDPNHEPELLIEVVLRSRNGIKVHLKERKNK